jgi:2-phospho-L-lactate transferase/gluconeogenesis factor (CofD/UPF0052 family)
LNKIKVILFTGGRGNANLINVMKETSHIELSLVINAFDDGLSTGLVRSIFPSLLGPSDFRKNISTLSSGKTKFHRKLSELMEFRIEKFNDSHSYILQSLQFEKLHVDFRELSTILTKTQKRFLMQSFNSALAKIDEDFIRVAEREISVGNLFFSGIFLNNECDFNCALKEYVDFFQVGVGVFNASNGVNQKLVAVTKNKNIVMSESSIVNHPQINKLENFLLLNDRQHSEFLLLDEESKHRLFSESESYHEFLNPDLNKIFESADLIIYGSGTLFSSIYPSFKILSGKIRNSKATKMVVLNLDHDNDIIGLDAVEIIQNHLKYLSDEKNDHQLIDIVISDAKSKIHNDLIQMNSNFPNIKFVNLNLRDHKNPNQHDGFLLADTIFDEFDRHRLQKMKENYVIPLLFDSRFISFEEINAITFDMREIMLHDKFPSKLFFEIFSYDSSFKKLSILNNIINMDYEVILSLENNVFFNRLDLIASIYDSLNSNTENTNVQFSRYIDRKSLSKNINQLYYQGGAGKYLYHLSHLTQLSASFFVKIFGYGHLDQDPFIGINLYNVKSLRRILNSRIRFCSNSNLNIALHKHAEEFVLYSLPYEEILYKGVLKKRISYALRFFRDIAFGRFLNF